MLAPNITTLEEQQRAVADADLVRPPMCPTCDEGRMHVHDYRTRKPRGAEDWPPVIATVRFRCGTCKAVWLVLPGFLARHLWRVWTTVGVILGSGERRRVRVPKQTRRRWLARADSSGRALRSILAVAGEALGRIASSLGPDPSREEVARALGGPGRLAEAAALIDRLAPAVRVM